MVKAQDRAKAFAADLSGALSGRLESVLLYGSAARGEYIEGKSDINVLVLLDDINGASLGATAPVVRKYLKQGMHPIVLESSEWRRATDVFAIEIADMQDAHVAIEGHDPLEGITIQLPILRLQAERELRGKMLQIYLTMLITEKPAELGALLMSTMPSLVTYFRTALRLARRPVPADSAGVLREAGVLTGADTTALLRVLEARATGSKLAVNLTDPLVDEYNTAIETLVKFIDNFGR